MKETITAQNAPKALGPYSHAIKVGNMVYTSGQIGIDPQTGVLKEGIEEQTKQVLKNLEAVLSAANVKITDVIKTTVFVADLKDFATVNQIYGEVFTQKPARSCVQAAALPASALVEIEVIAISEN